MGLLGNVGKQTKLKQIKTAVTKAIKEGRLVFVDDKSMDYTDQEGNQYKFTFLEYASEFLLRIDPNQQMTLAYFGINETHIVDILRDEYKRQQKKKG